MSVYDKEQKRGYLVEIFSAARIMNENFSLKIPRHASHISIRNFIFHIAMHLHVSVPHKLLTIHTPTKKKKKNYHL